VQLIILLFFFSPQLSAVGIEEGPAISEQEGCVTFILDMCGASLDPEGAYFAASFQGWDSEPMCDMGGDIWEISYCGIEPGTHEYKFLSGSGGWEFNGFGDDCTNPADNNNRFVDVSGGCDIEGPWCFNTCDEGSGSGPDDSDPPVLTGNLPDDITISCDEDLPDEELLDAEDDCSHNCTSELPVDDFSGFDDDCGIGIVIRTWEVFDCAGNEGEPHIQVITIVDQEAPAFDERVDDITLNCDEPLPPALPLEVIDNCDDELVFSDPPLDDTSRLGPDGLGDIIRMWYVEDCSGNPAEILQTITLTGAVAQIDHDVICASEGGYLVSGPAESYEWLFIDSNQDTLNLGVNNDSLFVMTEGVYILRIQSGGCTAEVSDTISFIETPMAESRDSTICLNGAALDIELLIERSPEDSLLIFDEAMNHIPNTIFNPMDYTTGTYPFFIEIYSDSICPPYTDTLQIELINCECPDVNDIGDYCMPLLSDTIALDDYRNFDLPGTWLIDNPAPGIFIENRRLVILSNAAPGMYIMSYEFDDVILNENCLNISPSPNMTLINLVASNPPMAVGTAVCNMDIGSALSTIVNLDTLLLSSNTGTWVSTDQNLLVSMDNLVDFTGVEPGSYSFVFTQNDNISPCEAWTANVSIEVFDCSCEPVSTIGDSTICNTDGPINLDDFVIAGAGTWSIKAAADADAMLMGSEFGTSMLSEGEYLFEYRLDGPLQGENCDSISTTRIQVLEAPQIISEAFDTRLCTGPNPQGLPFILNLFDFISQGTDDGEWSSADFPGDISDPFNIDMTGIDVGSYTFTLTTITAQQEGSYCDEVSQSYAVTLQDCNCPQLPILDETDRCVLNDSIVLSIPTNSSGAWTVRNPDGTETEFTEEMLINTNTLESGTYGFTFQLDNPPDLCADTMAVFEIQLFDPLELAIPSVIQLCGAPGFSQGPSELDFEGLQSGTTGTWIADPDYSGNFNDLSSVNFEGLAGQSFEFLYSPDDGDNPCDVLEYVLEIDVLDCECPNVLIQGSPILCNDSGQLDLTTLLSQDIVDGYFRLLDNNFQEIATNISSIDASQLVEGQYFIEYIASADVDIPGSCLSSSQVELSIIQAPDPGIAMDTAVCFGTVQLIELFDLLESESPGGEWSQNSGPLGGFDSAQATFNTGSMPAGTYTFTYSISPAQFCNAVSSSITVTIHELPEADAGSDQVLDCKTSSVSIGTPGNPGSSYEWRLDADIIAQDQAVIVVEQAGNYVLSVCDNLTGCKMQDEVLVTEEIGMPQYILQTTDSDCFGDNNGAIEFLMLEGGTGDYFVYIEGDTVISLRTASEILFENIAPGAYSGYVESNGCISDTTDFVILEGEDISFDFTTDQVNFSEGENYSFDLAEADLDFNSVTTVEWTYNNEILCSGDVSQCGTFDFQAQESGILLVTVFDERGCFYQDSIIFTLVEIESIYVPNIFSPGDIQNGRLQIFSSKASTLIENYRIYDRWGNLIFENAGSFRINSADSEWWDGRFNDDLVQAGVYVLYLQYKKGGDSSESEEMITSISVVY